MRKISVYIVDDHQMLIDGIQALLHNEPNIEVIGSNALPNVAMEEIKKLKPQLVLTDMQMPGISGAALIQTILKEQPSIKFLALTMAGDKHSILEMINAGASGYVLKNTGKAELVLAINTVVGGGKYFSTDVVTALAQAEKQSNTISLTAREIEIVKLIAAQNTNAQIGEILFISETTVETHRKNILRKTETKGILALVIWAKENGLL